MMLGTRGFKYPWKSLDQRKTKLHSLCGIHRGRGRNFSD